MSFVEAEDKRIHLPRGPSADWRYDPVEGFFFGESSFGVVYENDDIPRFVIYGLYSFENGRWVRRERRHYAAPGEWLAWVRSVEPFPTRDAFP